MQKILISWVAENTDFHYQSTEVNLQKSPNFTLHKELWADYDRHLLLSSAEKSDEKLTNLTLCLKENFPDHQVNPTYLNVKDPINHNEIRRAVEPLLLDYQDDEIHIFISPGTPAMQTVWLLCHWGLNLQTKLFQVRPPEKSISGKPERVSIEIETSPFTSSFAIRTQETPSKEIFRGESLKQILSVAKFVAETDANVLLSGEIGTGKSVLARFIHANSPQANALFQTFNPLAFNHAEAMEITLFGCVKDFKSQNQKKKDGLVKQCKDAILFLKNIDVLPFSTQEKLLRLIQERRYYPLGSEIAEKSNTRLIFSSTKNLIEACTNGSFRWDLYYQISIAELQVPTLRDRGVQEIEDMIQFLSKKFANKYRRKQRLKFSIEALNALKNATYWGNVQELESIIERCHLFCLSEVQLTDLPQYLQQKQSNRFNLQEIEKALIIKALQHFKGNKTDVCQAIGYKSRKTLYDKIQEYNIIDI